MEANKVVKTVQVKFNSYDDKVYDFKTDLDNIEAGDTLVCMCARGLQLVTVSKVLNKVTPKSTAWIIQKVDLTEHKTRLEAEAKEKERQAQLKKLKTEMDNRRKQLEDVAVFAFLAKEDAKMAELLASFNALNEGGKSDVQ